VDDIAFGAADVRRRPSERGGRQLWSSTAPCHFIPIAETWLDFEHHEKTRIGEGASSPTKTIIRAM
jgi:hypothetical protein